MNGEIICYDSCGISNITFKARAYHQAITLLEELKDDIPFSLLYSYDLSSDNFVLTQSAGIPAEQDNNIG